MPPTDFDTGSEPVQPDAMDRPAMPDDSSRALLTGSPPVRTAGAIPGMAGVPAFSTTAIEPSVVPVVIAVPHAGQAYPPQVLAQLRDSAANRLRLEDRLVDRLGEAVARQTGAPLIVAHAPRAVIDLNRATDDIDWGMVAGHAPDRLVPPAPSALRGRARSGLGLVPRRLPGTGEIWKSALDPAELAARIAGIHQPYHHTLAAILAQVRERWGAVLLIDLHSMPPVTPWPGAAPPEFVIGDRFGGACSGALVAAAFGWFSHAGRITTHNRPYAGGYVLERHAAPARRIHALQIEVDRRCYLDPALAELGEGFAATAELLSGLVAELATRVAELGAQAPGRGWADAAE